MSCPQGRPSCRFRQPRTSPGASRRTRPGRRRRRKQLRSLARRRMSFRRATRCMLSPSAFTDAFPRGRRFATRTRPSSPLTTVCGRAIRSSCREDASAHIDPRGRPFVYALEESVDHVPAPVGLRSADPLPFGRRHAGLRADRATGGGASAASGVLGLCVVRGGAVALVLDFLKEKKR